MTFKSVTAYSEALARKATNLKALSNDLLQLILRIWYPIQFRKGYSEALIDLGSKVNTIMPTFAIILILTTRTTNIGGRKIDHFFLKTYSIVPVGFSLQDS